VHCTEVYYISSSPSGYSIFISVGRASASCIVYTVYDHIHYRRSRSTVTLIFTILRTRLSTFSFLDWLVTFHLSNWRDDTGSLFLICRTMRTLKYVNIVSFFFLSVRLCFVILLSLFLEWLSQSSLKSDHDFYMKVCPSVGPLAQFLFPNAAKTMRAVTALHDKWPDIRSCSVQFQFFPPIRTNQALMNSLSLPLFSSFVSFHSLLSPALHDFRSETEFPQTFLLSVSRSSSCLLFFVGAGEREWKLSLSVSQCSEWILLRAGCTSIWDSVLNVVIRGTHSVKGISVWGNSNSVRICPLMSSLSVSVSFSLLDPLFFCPPPGFEGEC